MNIWRAIFLVLCATAGASGAAAVRAGDWVGFGLVLLGALYLVLILGVLRDVLEFNPYGPFEERG